MIGYVAKDKDGQLYLHPEFPHYDDEYKGWFSTSDSLNITNKFPEFNDISYTDEPIAVDIKLRKIQT